VTLGEKESLSNWCWFCVCFLF